MQFPTHKCGPVRPLTQLPSSNAPSPPILTAPEALPRSAPITVMSQYDQHATSSCLACRQLKRKCSKHLPSCTLCVKVGRMCEYPTPSEPPERSIGLSSTGPSWTNQALGNTRESLLSLTPTTSPARAHSATLGASRVQAEARVALASVFLDSVHSRDAAIVIPDGLQWQDVSSAAPTLSVEEAKAVAQDFFQTTHEWLPISK